MVVVASKDAAGEVRKELFSPEILKGNAAVLMKWCGADPPPPPPPTSRCPLLLAAPGPCPTALPYFSSRGAGIGEESSTQALRVGAPRTPQSRGADPPPPSLPPSPLPDPTSNPTHTHAAFPLRSRTFGAIVAGLVAGILGLTGIWGALCYFAANGLISAVLYQTLGTRRQKFFPSKKSYFLDGLTAQIATFILFWTLAYDIVHIF